MTVNVVYIRVYKLVIKLLNLVSTKTIQIDTKIWVSPMLILSEAAKTRRLFCFFYAKNLVILHMFYVFFRSLTFLQFFKNKFFTLQNLGRS